MAPPAPRPVPIIDSPAAPLRDACLTRRWHRRRFWQVRLQRGDRNIAGPPRVVPPAERAAP